MKKCGIVHDFMDNIPKNSHFSGIDINRCRKSILYYNNDPYCAFSILDNIQI